MKMKDIKHEICNYEVIWNMKDDTNNERCYFENKSNNMKYMK